MSESKDNGETNEVEVRSHTSANAIQPGATPNEFVLRIARELEQEGFLDRAVDVAEQVATILTELGATSARALRTLPDHADFGGWFEPLTKGSGGRASRQRFWGGAEHGREGGSSESGNSCRGGESTRECGHGTHR